MSTITPLGNGQLCLHALKPTRPTHIMAILNLTPDSFSDGGKHKTNSLSETINTFISSRTTIFDIGGQSSSPGTPDISATEEISRVLPAISAVRAHPKGANVIISIDTYRAPVAEAAVIAGADIINDISAGLLDSAMLPTVARLGSTICLMHMRGTPATMTHLTDYSPHGLIPTIAEDLLQRVAAAEEAGIRRWRIILDPGIGFAKTGEQNLEILRRMDELRDWPGLRGLPWLLGSSRKTFIGRITGVEVPSQRTWGTAATVAAAIQGGADIVRVHDAVEMGQVAKMSDAIWRA
jgi:2-amino-4-hydroxy-6-hydroxymethyldihydropteridine diphosphokinase/dihydropteroate synthase